MRRSEDGLDLICCDAGLVVLPLAVLVDDLADLIDGIAGVLQEPDEPHPLLMGGMRCEEDIGDLCPLHQGNNLVEERKWGREDAGPGGQRSLIE